MTQAQSNPYQYLMADEYYLDNNHNYTGVKFENVQFLLNLEDNDAPIFQPKLLINPYASLIGNYCMKDSSIVLIQQIDPIFACIKVLSKLFITEPKTVDFDSLFDRENQLSLYLNSHKKVIQNIDLICKTILDGDELYVTPDKKKLFAFLDLKFNSIVEYINQDPNQTYIVNSFNTKDTDEAEVSNCTFFIDYLSPELYAEYRATKQVVRNDLQTQLIGNFNDNSKIGHQKTPSVQKVKKVSKEQSDLEKVAKNCVKIDSFFIKKP